MQEQESIKKLFKDLTKNKNDEKKATSILSKINKHLLDKSFRFTKENTDMLYPYLYVSNKYLVTSNLNNLLDNQDFVSLLDSSKISGSMLLSLTSNCHKPRLNLLKYSKKIKDSILKGDELLNLPEIINDLTPEEITYLRKDTAIDNLLIKNGLSFATLNSTTKEQILNDLSILKLYNLNTIKDFASTYPVPQDLINNKDFLNIYLSKLDTNYNINHPLFKYLTLKNIEYILNLKTPNNIILHLLKNTDKLVQQEILKIENIDEIIIKSKSEAILKSLPYNYLKKLLVSEKKLFSKPYINILIDLPIDKLKVIAEANKNYYLSLLTNLNKLNYKADKLINALPDESIKDLKVNQLINLDLIALTNLCHASITYKKALLKNSELCTKIVNNLSSKEYYLLDNLFSLDTFTTDDKILFISNVKEFKNPELLNYLLKDIPLSKRKYFYDNIELRTNLVNDKTYTLDEYAISHYLNNINEIPSLNSILIKELLTKTDLNFNSQVLSNPKVVEIIFNYAKKDYHIIPAILKNRPSLIKYFKEPKYYNKELLSNILNELDYQSKKELCSNDLIKSILKDKYYNIYKKLLNINAYLLNTIDFRLFEDYICDLKISLLSYLTKYPSLEQNLIIINKYYHLTSSFINNLYYSLEDLNRYETLNNIFSLLVEATIPKNRKRVGNLPKLIADINYTRLPKKDLTKLITYYLYMIPRFFENNESLPRPIVIKAPHTYEEIINYEDNTVAKLTNLINTESDIKDYFIQKHFKLTLAEAKLVTKMYDFTHLDTNTYNEEYIFITNLNKIINTDNNSLKELDKDYKVISMYDSYRLINQINKMYAKIYNYELRSKNNNLKSSVINFYNKEITIYKSREDFLYLVANLDLETPFLKTNSYFNSYHNLVNNLDLNIPCSLLTKDNLVFASDFLLGYNGLLDEGLSKMSNYYLTDYQDQSKDYYASITNLIDNTRDYNNTICLNKYALRPNYNNDNIPNIEPDYILVDAKRLKDNIYLSKIVNISLEFKSKHHPEGLPIIALDPLQISKKELSNINKLLKEYTTTYDPYLLKKLLTKLENNYTAYRHTNKEEALKYDIYLLLSTIINRINNTNSIYELNEIADIFTKEYQKYTLLSPDNKCNYYLDYIKKHIESRKKSLNTY